MAVSRRKTSLSIYAVDEEATNKMATLQKTAATFEPNPRRYRRIVSVLLWRAAALRAKQTSWFRSPSGSPRPPQQGQPCDTGNRVQACQRTAQPWP